VNTFYHFMIDRCRMTIFAMFLKITKHAPFPFVKNTDIVWPVPGGLSLFQKIRGVLILTLIKNWGQQVPDVVAPRTAQMIVITIKRFSVLHDFDSITLKESLMRHYDQQLLVWL